MSIERTPEDIARFHLQLSQHFTEAAYMVRFYGGMGCNILVENLFNERWRAEAFRDSCTPSQDAKVVVLLERKS